MILADTSVWIDHFRAPDKELQKRLTNNEIAMHPFVVGELALGTLSQRKKFCCIWTICRASESRCRMRFGR